MQTSDYLVQNDGKHIDNVLQHPCEKHDARVQAACWDMPSRTHILSGVCGDRIRRAGYNGVISERSRTTKRFEPNRRL